MDSLNSWFGTSLSPLFWILAGTGLLVALLLIFAWRMLRRPHLHGTMQRNRQPRLGVIDSYPVDRVRQLVLVRRDNVEHLIMIGGPNDLVVESGILRARSATTAAPLPEKSTPPLPPEPKVVQPEIVSQPRPAQVEVSVANPERGPESPGRNRPAAPQTAAKPVAPARPQPVEEPRTQVDTMHFEELLEDKAPSPSHSASAPQPVRSSSVGIAAPARAEPGFTEQDHGRADAVRLEAEPQARRTAPGIRLPDLKIPELRRPLTSPEPALPQADNTRYSSYDDHSGSGETMALPPVAEPGQAPPPTGLRPAAEPDPFASLEEEMANLLGRRNDKKTI